MEKISLGVALAGLLAGAAAASDIAVQQGNPLEDAGRVIVPAGLGAPSRPRPQAPAVGPAGPAAPGSQAPDSAVKPAEPEAAPEWALQLHAEGAEMRREGREILGQLSTEAGIRALQARYGRPWPELYDHALELRDLGWELQEEAASQIPARGSAERGLALAERYLELDGDAAGLREGMDRKYAFLGGGCPRKHRKSCLGGLAAQRADEEKDRREGLSSELKALAKSRAALLKEFDKDARKDPVYALLARSAVLDRQADKLEKQKAAAKPGSHKEGWLKSREASLAKARAELRQGLADLLAARPQAGKGRRSA